MLVLSRKVGEQVVVPDCELTLTVLNASSGRVRLGIVAPPKVAVHRSEACPPVTARTTEVVEDTMMSLRILIADSDEFLMRSYRECLCQYGAAVATAPTALACVDRLRDFAPDVLVLGPDLLWGGADGVLALVHEEPWLRPAAVLLLTQGSDRSLLYRLSPYKVDDYQAKPLGSRQLMDRISALHIPGRSKAERRRAAESPLSMERAVVR